MTATPNHRTRPSRSGCNCGVPRAGSLSLGRHIMRRLSFIAFAVGIVILDSCSVPPRASEPVPTLEVEQVTHRWEIVIRLQDVSAPKSPRCGIFRVLEGLDGQEVEAHLADVRLNETDDRGSFIGVYSNGKEFPHGTEVVAIYKRSDTDSPTRAATRMFYH